MTWGKCARPEREGKKQVSAFVTLDRWRKLRNIATKTTRTQTDLITEAIDGQKTNVHSIVDFVSPLVRCRQVGY